MNYVIPDKYRGWVHSVPFLTLFAGALLTAAVTVSLSNTACAVTITVTNLNDSGPGSLRQAIADAAPGDTIKFSVTGTITLTSGELVINKSMTIQGPGANLLSVSGNNASRVFYIHGGVASTLDGMTVRDGYADGGGGISNNGTLTVNNSTISGNTAYYAAGGIANGGTMAVSNSTISGNSSTYVGGGIFTSDTELTITNSTVSGNMADEGGGIANSDGILTVSNSTVSGNTARIAGGISNHQDDGNPFFALTNTIVAGNSTDLGGDCGVNLSRHNLIGDAASSCGIVNGVNGNIVGANPLLGPLANNGGPTLTHALLPSSPAINAGDNCVLIVNGCGYMHPALTTDQRGILRFGTVDIGAFEWRLILVWWSNS